MGLSNALWPTLVGVAILIVGLVAARGAFTAAPGLDRGGLDKLIVLGPALVAGSIASFGGEHLTIAKDIAQGVPSYMPWHLFWAYFVGVALLAAGLSFAVGKCVRWSAPSLSLMIGLFVLMLSLPAVVEHPRNLLSWTLMLRDSCFSLGALALAATVWGVAAADPDRAVRPKPKEDLNGAPSFVATGAGRWVVLVARVVIGATLVLYGVEYLVHPAVAGGIPLEKMTPGWVPGLKLWGYLGGAVLVVGGAALLANKRARTAAAWVGVWMVVVTVLLYLPIFVLNPPGLKMEGMNYVFDTLMYGGTMWLLAGALPPQRRRPVAGGPGDAVVPVDEVRVDAGVPIL